MFVQAILHWLPPSSTKPFWTDVAAPYPKSLRGFSNLKVARFIIPIQWVEDFDNDPERYTFVGA